MTINDLIMDKNSKFMNVINLFDIEDRNFIIEQVMTRFGMSSIVKETIVSSSVLKLETFNGKLFIDWKSKTFDFK